MQINSFLYNIKQYLKSGGNQKICFAGRPQLQWIFMEIIDFYQDLASLLMTKNMQCYFAILV